MYKRNLQDYGRTIVVYGSMEVKNFWSSFRMELWDNDTEPKSNPN